MSRINAYGLSSKEYASLYDVWKNMLDRCYNDQNDRFYTYGERGVSVCEEWREDFHVFARWALENGWNQSLWIERADVNGSYSPSNCTFIGRKEQMRNKTNNVIVCIDGVEKCFAEWCELFGVDYYKAWARYRVHGISDANLIFYPGDLREKRPGILQFALDGRLIEKHSRITEASRKSGMSVSAIRRMCQGKTGKPSKYVWRYEAVDL